MANPVSDQYILQSVDNTLSLLELFCDHEKLSLADIVSMTEYGKSSVFRMLATLEKHQLIIKTGSNAYRLGYRLASMGAIVVARMELVEIAHPFLQELAARTKETTHLSIMIDDTKTQFIDKVRGDSSIWMESTVGMTRDLHLTGAGKTILAFSKEAQIERYISCVQFEKLTQNTIVSGKDLKSELQTIRLQGYGCDCEESEKGLVCFAAPIRDFKGNVVAALSISGFKDRMFAQKESFIHDVIHTASQISNAL